MKSCRGGRRTGTGYVLTDSEQALSGSARIWLASSAAPFLWAHGAGQTDIVFGVPGDNLMLLFHFPPGKDSYRELVSKPGLAAFVTVEKSSGWFIGVGFRQG